MWARFRALYEGGWKIAEMTVKTEISGQIPLELECFP